MAGAGKYTQCYGGSIGYLLSTYLASFDCGSWRLQMSDEAGSNSGFVSQFCGTLQVRAGNAADLVANAGGIAANQPLKLHGAPGLVRTMPFV